MNWELNANHRVGLVFTDSFLTRAEAVRAVIFLLDRQDTHIRLLLPTIKLFDLFFFSSYRSEELKERVLDCQMGLAKIMNVLGSSRDVVRNEVLRVLIKLTGRDVSIQGFLVFDSGLKNLFESFKFFSHIQCYLFLSLLITITNPWITCWAGQHILAVQRFETCHLINLLQFKVFYSLN